MPDRFRNLSPAQERAFERIACGESSIKGIDWSTVKALMRCGLVAREAAAPEWADYVRPSFFVPEAALQEYRDYLLTALSAGEEAGSR